jgi:hypothetical protein
LSKKSKDPCAPPALGFAKPSICASYGEDFRSLGKKLSIRLPVGQDRASSRTMCSVGNIGGVACALFLGLCGLDSLEAKEVQPEPKPSLAPPAVEAWAMLFQMMDRLRAAVTQHDLTLIHLEDPVASTAVSTLMRQVANSSMPNAPAKKIAWTVFVRDISALHTAADAAQEEACVALLHRADNEFQKLQEDSEPAVLQGAHHYAERYTCPMHPEVLGAKNDTCGKCGMTLDQLVVLLPSDAGLTTQHAVRATITTAAPLELGKLAKAVLHLRRGENEPVTPAELIETHTRKIHLLIVDGSLADYHHEHPQPTTTPGDYAFEFTPRKPGPYLAWADLRPLPLGLQEYEKTVIAGIGQSDPVTDKSPRLAGDADRLHFDLRLAQPELKVGVPARAKLKVTKPDGSGFDQLEPVMAAFAHLVGFNEDKETVLHMHPSGAPVSNESERGGPELDFKIYATKPGFVRLFAQVQINGRQLFVPFNIKVVP